MDRMTDEEMLTRYRKRNPYTADRAEALRTRICLVNGELTVDGLDVTRSRMTPSVAERFPAGLVGGRTPLAME
jgi:hypothetical protein